MTTPSPSRFSRLAAGSRRLFTIMRYHATPYHAYIPLFLNIFSFGIAANPVQQFINMYFCASLHREIDPTARVGSLPLPPFESCTRFADVQSRVTVFTQQISLLTAIPAIVMTPVIGMQSDRFGRRTIIFIPLICGSLSSLSYILITNFNVSIYLMYVVHAIQGFLGSYNVLMMTLLTFLADISPQEKRSHLFSMFEIMVLSSFTLGPFVGGLLTRVVRIETIFYLTFGFKMLILISTFFFFPESYAPLRKHATYTMLKEQEEKEKELNLQVQVATNEVHHHDDGETLSPLSDGYASGSSVVPETPTDTRMRPLTNQGAARKHSFGQEYAAVPTDDPNVNASMFSEAPFTMVNNDVVEEEISPAEKEKEEAPQRRRLPSPKDFLLLFSSKLGWLCTCILFIANLSVSATAVTFQYVMYRYGWNSYSFGNYCLVTSAANAICLLLTPKTWHPQYMLLVSFIFFFLEYLSRGYAITPAVMYVSGILGAPAVLSKPMVRTILSRSVDAQKQSILLSAAQTVEGLSVVFGNIFLPIIYRVFINKDQPGVVWFALSGIDIFAAGLSILLIVHMRNMSKKSQAIEEEAKEQARVQEEENHSASAHLLPETPAPSYHSSFNRGTTVRSTENSD